MPTSCITAPRLVTPDGTAWTLRYVGGDGDGRYAPESVTDCPRWVMEPGARLVSEHEGRPVANPQVPDLSASPDATWSRVLLRVDAIQRRALLEMAAAWNEEGGEEDIVSAMAVLADTVSGDSTVEEEDGAVDSVAEAAVLQGAEVELTLDEARRLRADLDAAIARVERRIDSAGIDSAGAVAA